MSVDLVMAPKREQPAGEGCCEPVAHPGLTQRDAERLALAAKALADPIRLQLVDVLRKHAGEVCVCEHVRARYADVARAGCCDSLGCGVPTAVADLHEGETVLDLGSGAGADVLISARRVGPGGRGSAST